MCNLILSTLSTLALLIHPLSLSAQNFSLSMDVNGAAGDQAVTSVNVSADQVIAIQIFGKDIQNANGLAAVRFEYDAVQVVYEGFDAGDVLPNARVFSEQGTNPTFVEIDIVSFDGQATANSGLLGTIHFRTMEAFSGTTIQLVRAELGRGGQIESATMDVRVELRLQALPSDFNGDGAVNFVDFLTFTSQFGIRQGDGRYEPKYDLDGDGSIGFSDFLIFVDNFGKKVSSTGGEEQTQAAIPDANLRIAIETALGKARGAPVTRAEMASLTSLEVPNSNISDLKGLEFATSLIRLDLSNKYVSGEGYVNSNEISDLSPLSGLNNLTWLNLFRNSISDVSALSGLTKLTWLNLSGNSISDVSFLYGLNNLTWLGLSGNSISDVYPLSGLTKLEWLDLRNNHNIPNVLSALSGLINLRTLLLSRNTIVNASALSGLTKLTRLDLAGTFISDVSFLYGLNNLTWLNLGDNSISDVSALSGLTKLTRLDLSDTDISDVSALFGLTRLEWLDLRDNRSISDVSALSGLTKLTKLYLRANNISDVSALSGLTKLTTLDLRANIIVNVSALSGLTKLTTLDLRNNRISDVSALSGLTKLTTLYLVTNRISDVSALSGLINLRSLTLSDNSISDIAPLVSNMGLGSGDAIDISNNPLSDTSLNIHIPALQGRGVTVYFSASKPAFEEKERGIIREEWETKDYISRGRIEVEEEMISQESRRPAKARREAKERKQRFTDTISR